MTPINQRKNIQDKKNIYYIPGLTPVIYSIFYQLFIPCSVSWCTQERHDNRRYKNERKKGGRNQPPTKLPVYSWSNSRHFLNIISKLSMSINIHNRHDFYERYKG